MHSIIEPACSGVVDKIVKVIGAMFLIFVQYFFYKVEERNTNISTIMEVPMNKKKVFDNLIKAFLLFLFSVGTNLLAAICLQTQ